MKKIAKMSLVAAMAIAGLTNANAGSLEEAIKDVKLSGFVSYTMEKVNNDSQTTDKEAQHDIDVRIQAVIPVNDMITATIRVDEANDDDNDNYGVSYDSDTDTTTNNKKTDSNSLKMELDRVYFTYKNAGFKSDFGLIQAPLTDAAQGDGITITKTLGSVALGAGYFYTTAVNSDELAFVSIAGSAASVNYSAVYASVMDSDDSDTNTTSGDNDADMLHLALSTKLDMLSLAANYSQKTGLKAGGITAGKAGNAKDQSQYRLDAKVDFGMINVGLAYAANGSDGGFTMYDNLDTANSGVSIGNLELQGMGDTSVIVGSISADLNAQNNVSVVYAQTSYDAQANVTAKTANGVAMQDDGMSIIKVTYTNKMSKNFKVYANYEINDIDGQKEDYTELTLGAKYSF